MRVPNTIGWGIGLALATAIISGFSIYLNGRFVKLFDDRPGPGRGTWACSGTSHGGKDCTFGRSKNV